MIKITDHDELVALLSSMDARLTALEAAPKKTLAERVAEPGFREGVAEARARLDAEDEKWGALPPVTREEAMEALRAVCACVGIAAGTCDTEVERDAVALLARYDAEESSAAPAVEAKPRQPPAKCDERCVGYCNAGGRCQDGAHRNNGCKGWVCNGTGPAHRAPSPRLEAAPPTVTLEELATALHGVIYSRNNSVQIVESVERAKELLARLDAEKEAHRDA